MANVLLVLPSITINGSPAVAGSDPFRIEPGDNVVFTPRANYSFGNFKQLDGQQTAPTSGVSIRAITPLAPSYWDINGDTAGAGGETPSGTWDTTAAHWTSAVAGDTATAAWTDGAVAAFSAGSDATGLYTVTLAGTRTVSGLRVESGDLELAGAALDFSSGPLGVGNLAFLTLTSAVTGTPASRIEAGSLLLLNADQTLGALRGSGSISCGSQNLVTDHAGVASFSGSLQSSTGTLTKRGSGELRLDRASHIIGGDLVVEAGTLTLAKDQGNQGALTSAPLFRVKSGATLDISSAPVTLGGTQQLAGAGTVAAANRTTWSQPAGNNFAAQVAIVTDALTVLGTIDPGDEGIGQLAIPQGTVNLLGGSILKIQIDDSATPKSDKLLLGGALKIQSGATLELGITGTPTAASYELIQYTGTAPAGTFTVVNLPAGYRIEHAFNGNTVALVKNSPFDAWATANGIPGAAFAADGPDKDGIANGVEYALGLNPTAFDALPSLAPAASDFTWTLPKGPEAAADPGIGYFFETSGNLSDWTKVAPTSQDGSSFSFLLPGGQGRQFVRIVIDQL
jgi:autotransporter-associated beta strand protein